jgi:excisionase family DNA binding protein
MEIEQNKAHSPEVLTPEQVAEYLQLPLDIVLISLEQREMPGLKIGNAWRVRRKLLDQWLDEKSLLVIERPISSGSAQSTDETTAVTIVNGSLSDQQIADQVCTNVASSELDQVSTSPVELTTNEALHSSLEIEEKPKTELPTQKPTSPELDTIAPQKRELERMQGIVKSFNPKQGFGFIKADDGREIYVHAVDVEDYGQTLRKRDRVSFQVRRVPKGWQAYDVMIVGKASRSKTPSTTPPSKPVKSVPTIHPQAQIAFERALAAREIRDYKRARELFEEAIRKGPFLNVFQAYSAMEERTNPENAGRVLEKGIQYFPDAGILYNDYAMLRRRLGDLPGALDILRRGLSAAPAFARQLHWSLAAVLVELEKEEYLDEAAEHAQEAKKLGQDLRDDWRYVKLQILTGPTIGKRTYQFFQQSGFKIETRSFNRQYADLLVYSDLPEYVETYDLRDKILVRCFYSAVTQSFLTVLQNTLRDLPSKLRGVNQDVAFLVTKDITPLRDSLYRLMGDNREAIVPIDSTLLLEANQDGDPSSTLRPILDQWLSRRDLYRFNYPVYGRRFFGRELDLQRLMRDIDDGHNVGVFGLRKVGKTSLLKQLRELRPQDIVVYFDLQGTPPDTQDCAYLYWAIARALREEVGQKKIDLPQLDGIVFQLGNQNAPQFQKRTPRLFDHDVHAVLSRLEQQGLATKTILIIDEVDRLLPAPGFNEGFRGYPDFFAYLRGTSQNSNGRFVTIITAANPALCEQAIWEGRDNPVFQFYHQMFLPPLTQQDCTDMVVKLGKGMGMSYDDDSLNAIFQATSGHPYLTRLLCSQISQMNPVRPLYVIPEIVTQARNEFLRGEATSIFDEILGRLDKFFPVERDLLMFIADGVDDEIELGQLVNQPIDVALYHLIGYQLVERSEEKYRIKIEMLHEWLRRYRLGREM